MPLPCARARCSATAQAIESPSKVAVPRPISSSSTRLRRGGVAEDVRRLLHLDHERGLAAQDLVGGAHPGEDPVDQADLRLARGHEAAHLGHEHDERGLAEEGGLAAHVRPGEDEEVLRGVAHGEVYSNLHLLARKLVERAGKTGEHYIALTRRQYWQMLGSAAGGGLITLGTASLKVPDRGPASGTISGGPAGGHELLAFPSS